MSKGVVVARLNEFGGAYRFCYPPLEGPCEGCFEPLGTLDLKLCAVGGACEDGKSGGPKLY